MSLDTSLTHDGTLTTAFANYYNPLTPLAGPGGSGQFLAMVFQANHVSQVQTTQGGPMIGVLQNTPLVFDPCDIGISGITKAVAGAAVTFGQELMVDSSGRFIPWLAGPSNLLAGATWTTGVSVITMGVANPGSVTAGMTVYDTTNGFPIGTVSSYVSTTLTLTANAAHASSGAADSLTFGNYKVGLCYETAAANGLFSMLIYNPNIR
jgi:hypothetical protein